MPSQGLPPDLFDRTTVLSLLSTAALVLTAYTLSLRCLSARAPATLRFLFIWHAADALCHFLLEGSFLYLCFFASTPADQLQLQRQPATSASVPTWPTPHNWLNRGAANSAAMAYGPQAGGENPFAQLWMVYARADHRWAGVDLAVVSLELLTVFFDGPLAVYICYCLSKKDPKAYIWMIILATAEIYGGFMTFCPEWLTGSHSLDTSNGIYLYVYLAFFNLLWVFIPFYAIWVSVVEISDALHQRSAKQKTG